MEHVLKTTYFVATFWDALASTWLPGYPRPGSKVGFSNASRVKARRKDTKGPSGPPPWSMMRQRDWKKAFILYTYIYIHVYRTVSHQMTSFCYKFGKKTLHVISIYILYIYHLLILNLDDSEALHHWGNKFIIFRPSLGDSIRRCELLSEI